MGLGTILDFEVYIGWGAGGGGVFLIVHYLSKFGLNQVPGSSKESI